MDALLKRASLIFDIPEGASLWERWPSIQIAQ